ncbi:TetR/AcrR family transcriptional regulator [Pseudomonas sp. PCH199]|uniref:TetR/AcrR family transcriptional regulator n=1 Tax=unclassified Pseudomonas TaxID=196821 RepID=UPI000BC4698B|nr:MULTISPECIES: TetR/AcrR family transcriptional regulator [unclassified Pseudomonas]MCW8277265.1 TetR/AcrR family transcriptional regulator [Pseudomonas sp. PCH199]PAM82480.1 TetR family transcriptional regulator [Pseudomonas sp. ERMR1:02]
MQDSKNCGEKKSGESADSADLVKLTTRRLSPEVREKQIVQKAIEHFATCGFSGSTRELARQLDVTQPLLYRYFPSKEALIDRVYDEVYRWDSSWETMIKDRSQPLQSRLVHFYTSYAGVILRREWIRIFVFAGLTRAGINDRYLSRLRERVFIPVIAEIRHAHGLAPSSGETINEKELELIWSLHASIFYIGMRKWIYDLPVTEDIDALIEQMVDAFLNGSPHVLQQVDNDLDEKSRLN